MTGIPRIYDLPGSLYRCSATMRRTDLRISHRGNKASELGFEEDEEQLEKHRRLTDLYL